MVKKIIDIESRIRKEYSVILVNPFNLNVKGFLSIDSTDKELKFTNNPKLILLITKIDAEEIKNQLMDKVTHAHIVNTRSGEEKDEAITVHRFKVAKIEHQQGW